MPLAPNTQFDHYEILSPLGKGGMGEVYRAKDIRLNREVAIKVLPGEVAHDAERLRRFELEARAVGALNHPNILTVYDFGNYEGNPYIVMELLEGEELRVALDDGALPAHRCVDYAQQIANGLSAAHAKNIVHRDLKPANLFVTTDGRVKILDFGLAKLTEKGRRGEGEKGRLGEDDDTLALPPPLPHSPSPPLTDPGVVLGTVGYMSPEQVQGQVADHRSDIFSFGVLLYEMLSGQRAFLGDSLVETMHAILRSEPPELREINAKISPALDKIVRRCLEKKPARRFQSASDLSFALEALSAGYAGILPASAGSEPTLIAGRMPAYPNWRERFAWIAASVLALALLALGVAYVRRPALEAEPMRFSIPPPDKATSLGTPMISPDGRTLAFDAVVGRSQIWVRPLNATTAKPLVEKSPPSIPFWSPDSRFIGFFSNGSLKKISLADGTTVTLCDAPSARTGAWSRAGIILLGAGADGIKRVSADGGAVTAVTTVDKAHGESRHTAPVFLPDGRHFLFHITNDDPAKTGLYAASLDGGAVTQVMPLETPLFAVTLKPGAANECLLLFVRQGALLVQSLELSRFQPAGEPVRLAEQVSSRFTVSENGVLVMSESRAKQQLTWIDRAGQKTSTVGLTGEYFTPHLSPDEQRLAVGLLNLQGGNYDIRVFDLTRGGDARFTTDSATDSYPLWSPDGQSIVWSSSREGVWNLYRKAANGAGTDELLLRSAYSKLAQDWSADGRFLLYRELNPQTGYDLWVLPMEGERQPWPWLNSPFVEGAARFSPDGKWIAYQSNESGRPEIYVQAFVPGAAASGGKVLISTNGGQTPQWRRDGRELYYLSNDGNLMAVDVTLGAEVKVGTPKPLFSLNNIRAVTNSGYSKTGDGQRFLFVTSAEDASVPPFTVVLNWMAEVKSARRSE